MAEPVLGGWSLYPSSPEDKVDLFTNYLQSFWTLEDKDWIRISLTDPIKYPTACLSIRALATAYYGKRNYCHELSITATRNYGKALVMLRQALLQDNGLGTFDILAASTALQRYEVMVCTTSTGWIQHAGGTARAMELCGPDRFKNYPNKAILDANGYLIIHEAYSQRRRTFLERKGWRSLRTGGSSQDLHFDKLQDLYARLAGLAEDVDIFMTEQRSKGQSEILHEADDLLEDLDSWLDYWRAEYHFEPTEEDFPSRRSSIYNFDQEPVFTSYLRYPSSIAGIGTNMYRALKIATLEWRHRVQNPSWWAGEDHERMKEVPKIEELAKDCCRSLGSHFRTANDPELQHRVRYLIFCSMIAYRALHRHSPEARWLVAVITDVGNRFGLELAKQLPRRRLIGWKLAGNPDVRQWAAS